MTNLKTAKALWLRQSRSCDWASAVEGFATAMCSLGKSAKRCGLSPAAWPICRVELQAIS
jgi:hypothetical protein